MRYLDMPEVEIADHPEAELVDHPDAELDMLFTLLTLRPLGV